MTGTHCEGGSVSAYEHCRHSRAQSPGEPYTSIFVTSGKHEIEEECSTKDESHPDPTEDVVRRCTDVVIVVLSTGPDMRLHVVLLLDVIYNHVSVDTNDGNCLLIVFGTHQTEPLFPWIPKSHIRSWPVGTPRIWSCVASGVSETAVGPAHSGHYVKVCVAKHVGALEFRPLYVPKVQTKDDWSHGESSRY